MNTKKVLYLLEILSQRTSGYENELAKLYEDALSENDDINRLRAAIKNYSFYGEIGNSIQDESQKLLYTVIHQPHLALELLPRVIQAYERIENDAQVCKSLMHSPMPFNDTITILKTNDIPLYRNALHTIASVCIYLIVLYNGLQPIQELYWIDGDNLQEMIESINRRFLPALCAVKRPSYSWLIRKHNLGGNALFGGDAFVLSYESTKSLNVLCSALHKESIGTHAFLNIKAYESNENDVPYCWGSGNILSERPDESLAFLTHDVVTKLRAPKPSELMHRIPAPYELIRRLSNDALFCITPDELVLAMNRWKTGHEIEKRKRTHSCLFCGKYVTDGKLVCSSHFQSELL